MAIKRTKNGSTVLLVAFFIALLLLSFHLKLIFVIRTRNNRHDTEKGVKRAAVVRRRQRWFARRTDDGMRNKTTTNYVPKHTSRTDFCQHLFSSKLKWIVLAHQKAPSPDLWAYMKQSNPPQWNWRQEKRRKKIRIIREVDVSGVRIECAHWAHFVLLHKVNETNSGGISFGPCGHTVEKIKYKLWNLIHYSQRKTENNNKKKLQNVKKRRENGITKGMRCAMPGSPLSHSRDSNQINQQKAEQGMNATARETKTSKASKRKDKKNEIKWNVFFILYFASAAAMNLYECAADIMGQRLMAKEFFATRDKMRWKQKVASPVW